MTSPMSSTPGMKMKCSGPGVFMRRYGSGYVEPPTSVLALSVSAFALSALA